MSEDESRTGELTEEMEAMAVWESHLKGAAKQWKEGVEHSEDDYRRGLAEFLGVDESEISEQVSHDWEAGVAEMSADEFASRITDEGDDWLVGFYEGVSGREAPQEVRDLAKEIDDQVIAQAGQNPEGEQLAEEIRQHVRQRTGGAAG